MERDTTETPEAISGNEPRADESPAQLPAPSGPETQAEKIPAPTFIRVSAGHLLAALSCASTEQARYYLNGVFVHRTKDGIRAVATDGHRLLIQTTGAAIEGEAADWLDDGVIVSASGLKARLKMLEDGPMGDTIKLGFARGARHVTLASLDGTTTFRVDAVDGQFPDYALVVKSATGAFVGELDRLRPAPFASKYLKAVGELGARLGAEAVSIYQPATGTDKDGKPHGFDGPVVVTFGGAPHALLYLMSLTTAPGFSATQVAMLLPAIKASVAALRAHETRNRKAAKGEKDAKARASLLASAETFKARIEALLATTRAALPAPEKAKPFSGVSEATPVPAPVEPEAEAAPVPPISEAVEPAAEVEAPREVERGAVIKRPRQARFKRKANGHAQANA